MSLSRNLQPNLDAKELIIAIYVSYNPEEKSHLTFPLVFTMKVHLYGFNVTDLFTMLITC